MVGNTVGVGVCVVGVLLVWVLASSELLEPSELLEHAVRRANKVRAVTVPL
jgi:hypothetical protein